jgi:hypothetical protein
LVNGITFNVEPTNSGEIYCMKHVLSISYSRFDYGTKITCKAKPNNKSTFTTLPIIGDWIDAAIIGGFKFNS